MPAAPLPSSTYIDRISAIFPLLIVVDLVYAHFLNKNREQKEVVFNSYWVYFFGIGSSGLVAREMKLRLMRLGVVCEALTDQDGFAWTTSILDSSCLVIGFSLSGSTSSITDSLLKAKEKGAKTILITSNPAAILGG